MNIDNRLGSVIVLVGVAMAAAPLAAQQPLPQARHAEITAAWQEAREAATLGPAKIALAGQAVLDLPAGDAFVPTAAANRVMAALGNRALDSRAGIIVPTTGKANWMIDVEWAPEGFVKDGDAKEWEPDTMLQSLKDGTTEQNRQRVSQGIRAIDITGWIQQPNYDAAAHQLIWSVAAREQGAALDQPQIVNYNTFALGREGFFSLDLITDSSAVAADKAAVRDVLAHLAYQPGKRYADFDSSTDKVAAFGLAGLVGAVAVKKLGLLAMVGAFLLKAWKVALLAMVGGWAAFKRRLAGLFGRGAGADDGPAEEDSAA